MTPQEEAWCDHAIAEGDKCADQIIDEMCEDVPDEFWGETVYALWIAMTHMLVDMGWSSEELQSDVATHAAMQTSEGRMQ